MDTLSPVNSNRWDLSAIPSPRIHSISIHGFTKIHGYQHRYPWFLDVSLQLSIQVWISTEISKQGYPCKDILQWISVNNIYPWMDIHVFMDISLELSMLLWISIWISLYFYWYPRIDLLWILGPGFFYLFICLFFMDPPPPHRGLTWFNKGFLPSLRNGPRGLCTVPSLLFTNQYTVAHQRHAWLSYVRVSMTWAAVLAYPTREGSNQRVSRNRAIDFNRLLYIW